MFARSVFHASVLPELEQWPEGQGLLPAALKIDCARQSSARPRGQLRGRGLARGQSLPRRWRQRAPAQPDGVHIGEGRAYGSPIQGTQGLPRPCRRIRGKDTDHVGLRDGLSQKPEIVALERQRKLIDRFEPQSLGYL